MVVALHPRRRRVARVLRHRHPRAGDARRRGARGRGARCTARCARASPRAPCRSARPLCSWSSWSRRGSQATRARSTTSSTAASGCSRYSVATRGGVVAPHAAIGGLVRSGPRVVAAALGRRDLVRDVPVALADVPLPDRGAHGARRRLAAGAAARGRRRPVVGDQRAGLRADPARRTSPLTPPGAVGRRDARGRRDASGPSPRRSGAEPVLTG